MKSTIGICTSPEHLTEAHEAGFSFAELGCSYLLPEQDEAAFTPERQKLLNSPIPVEAFNVFLPGRLKVTGPDVDLKAVGAHMDLVLRRASEVGASIMVFGSGGARRAPEGFPIDRAKLQFVAAARLAGETAARYGMTIALEPLFKRACNFFNRTDEGVAFVDDVNHPNLCLLTDLFHMTMESEPFENMLQAGPRLAHIHVATPSLPETGTQDGPSFDLPRFLAVLAQTGYAGRVSVEDNNGLLGKAPVRLAVAMRAVRQRVEALLLESNAP